METYKAARDRLISEFKAQGFKTSDPKLKVPWVELRFANGITKLYFRPQAIHMNGLSLWVDMRGKSAAEIIEVAKK